MNQKITYLDHEKIKRLPKNHEVRAALAEGLKAIISTKKTFDDLVAETEMNVSPYKLKKKIESLSCAGCRGKGVYYNFKRRAPYKGEKCTSCDGTGWDEKVIYTLKKGLSNET